MAKPYTAALPPNVDLTSGCTVQFVAIDPTDGSAVSGITVANIQIYADATGNATLEGGPFTLVDPKMLHKA